MTSATCPTCHQLVACDALGIRPHAYHGAPCSGGRSAPTMAPPAHHIALTPMVLAGRARRQVAIEAAKARRDALVRPHLPGHTVEIARATGLTCSSVRVICLRIGASLDQSTPRVWRMP